MKRYELHAALPKEWTLCCHLWEDYLERGVDPESKEVFDLLKRSIDIRLRVTGYENYRYFDDLKDDLLSSIYISGKFHYNLHSLIGIPFIDLYNLYYERLIAIDHSLSCLQCTSQSELFSSSGSYRLTDERLEKLFTAGSIFRLIDDAEQQDKKLHYYLTRRLNRFMRDSNNFCALLSCYRILCNSRDLIIQEKVDEYVND